MRGQAGVWVERSVADAKRRGHFDAEKNLNPPCGAGRRDSPSAPEGGRVPRRDEGTAWPQKAVA